MARVTESLHRCPCPPNPHEEINSPEPLNSECEINVSEHSGAEVKDDASGKGKVRKRVVRNAEQRKKNAADQRRYQLQRKERLKAMEEKVKDFGPMQESLHNVMEENYQLRDYILVLQSRLIEFQGEGAVLPPPFPPLTLANAPLPAGIDSNVQHQMVQAVQQQQQQLVVLQTSLPQQYAFQTQQVAITADIVNEIVLGEIGNHWEN
ncbi:hypothetical protein RUND412_006074 [Rhizina undulata]